MQEIWLDEVDCSIFDLRILDCSHNGIGVEDCSHYEDIMIRCIASPTATSDSSKHCVWGGVLCTIIHLACITILVRHTMS